MADATAQDTMDPSHRLRLVLYLMVSFRALTQLNESVGEATQEVPTTVDVIEGFLYRLGLWSEVYELQRSHLGKMKMMLGGEHPDTFVSMDNLGRILHKQGNYSEAQCMYQQVLALKERVLGTEHPETLRVLPCIFVAQYQVSRGCRTDVSMSMRCI